MRGVPLLRFAAWLVAIGLVALPVVGLLEGWLATDRWPVRQVRIEAEFAHVTAEQVRTAAADQLALGFFALDLAEVQQRVAQLPWVERVEARKHWPDTLVLRIYEQQPYARWGVDRLISRTGQLFTVPGADGLQGLPELAGPDERLTEVIGFHEKVRPLLAQAGLRVVRVALSDRGSWTLGLDSGATLQLGRGEVMEPLQRFLDVYPRLTAARQGAFEYADLRYANGFVMKWPPAPPAATPARPASPVPPPAAHTGEA